MRQRIKNTNVSATRELVKTRKYFRTNKISTYEPSPQTLSSLEYRFREKSSDRMFGFLLNMVKHKIQISKNYKVVTNVKTV
jgi:hypothetical protein